ncbi:MAG: hypothetical protein QM490_02390 [Candidatus Gracilibacteria bacterium]
MKELIKFIKENNIWVARILVIIGLFFIIKLWMMGLSVTSSGGGGFISIGIGWDFEYFWISAGYIAIILLIISVLLLFLISNTENKIRKAQIAFLILFFGLIGKQLFFLISPEYKFYLTPVTKQYKDKEGNVTDIDKYLDLVGNYCQDIKYYKIGNCNNKYVENFETVEEYIKVLNFANKTDDYRMYRDTFKGVEKYGIFNLLENYNDETFQVYAIFHYNFSDDDKKILKKIITNKEVIELLDFLILNENENLKLKEEDKYHSSNYFWQEYESNFYKKINKSGIINSKLF